MHYPREKNPFNSKTISGEAKGSFSGKIEDEKRIEKKEVKNEESKVEKKLKGDSRFNCHYCNRANNMANDCMLRKREERKNSVKDEAYYSDRLEEVRARTKGVSLVAKGEDDEEGTYQIWSSGSNDEEM